MHHLNGTKQTVADVAPLLAVWCVCFCAVAGYAVHPHINPASRSLRRSVEQLHAWDARRKLMVRNLRVFCVCLCHTVVYTRPATLGAPPDLHFCLTTPCVATTATHRSLPRPWISVTTSATVTLLHPRSTPSAASWPSPTMRWRLTRPGPGPPPAQQGPTTNQRCPGMKARGPDVVCYCDDLL